MKILYFGLLLSMALCAQAHLGRTDAEGCHAGKLPRHCHDNQVNRDTPAKDTNRSSARKTASEDAYNRRFCALVGGMTEARHTCTYDDGSSFVKGQTVKPPQRCTKADWTSAAACKACSRRCFSVS